MAKQQLKQNLIQIGLSANEALVYLALVELGPSFAGPVIKQTKLHRMLVYQALEKLKEQRLVSVMQRHGKQYFQPADPGVLIERVRTLETITDLTILQLKQMQNDNGNQLDINILHGHDGFITNLRTVVQQAAQGDQVLRILGGVQGDLFYESIGSWYSSYLELLRKYKVKKWQISPASNSAAFKDKFAREADTKLRTSTFSVASPIQTRITPTMVSIEIYARDIVVIQIYNPAVAAGYLAYFNLLWQQAIPYHLPKNKI